MSTVAEYIKRTVERSARIPAKGLYDRILAAVSESWQRTRRREIADLTTAVLYEHIRRGIAQQQLAIRLNCSNSQVTTVLKVEERITPEFGEKVIEVLGAGMKHIVGDLDRSEWLVRARMDAVTYVATKELQTAPAGESISREEYEFVIAIGQSDGELTKARIESLLRGVHAMPKTGSSTITADNYEASMDKWYLPYYHVMRALNGEDFR